MITLFGAMALCAIAVVPRLTVAPVRSLFVTVTIERGTARDAIVWLVGPQGLETSSIVQADRRTQEIEWTNLYLVEPGTYEVRLQTSSNCHARTTLTVAGSGHRR